MRHDYPILRRNRFLTGALDNDLDIRDVTWINANGTQMSDEEWADTGMKCFGMLLDGRAQATGIKQRGSEITVLVVLNAHHDVVSITLPDCNGCAGWRLLLDTNIPDEERSQEFKIGDTYAMTARSLVAFQLT
jgi:glycogen operon protein